MYLLEMFGISLGLTLLLELTVCYFWGMRTGSLILLVILVNILTNPAAVLLNWLGVSQIPIEVAVFAVEAWIYHHFSRDESWHIPHPMVLSAVANGISWGCGIIIGGWL